MKGCNSPVFLDTIPPGLHSQILPVLILWHFCICLLLLVLVFILGLLFSRLFTMVSCHPRSTAGIGITQLCNTGPCITEWCITVCFTAVHCRAVHYTAVHYNAHVHAAAVYRHAGPAGFACTDSFPAPPPAVFPEPPGVN